MNLEVIKTADGSLTLLNTNTGCYYHSIHGAFSEGQLVFVEYGLKYAIENFKSPINVLEVGFGAGLHTYLTLLEASKLEHPVFCTSIDIEPVNLEICKKLDYINLTDDNTLKENYFHLIETEWNQTKKINSFFTLEKLKCNIYDFNYSIPYHVVYYSGFSHQATPEVWEKVLFEKMYSALPIGACIVTHCAKGVFKRLLKEIGFKVESLAGPPRKNEVTRAIKL